MDETFREVSHGIWCLLALSLSFISASYVLANLKRPWSLEVRSAIAFGVCMFGAGLRGIWLWALAFYQAHNWDIAIFNTTISILLVTGATIIAIVGALCAIRVFSPVRQGHWVWMTAGTLSITIPILVHLIF